MYMLSLILVGLVAFEHLYFMYLEMFVWTTKKTRRVFGTTEEFAEASKSLADSWRRVWSGAWCNPTRHLRCN